MLTAFNPNQIIKEALTSSCPHCNKEIYNNFVEINNKTPCCNKVVKISELIPLTE